MRWAVHTFLQRRHKTTDACKITCIWMFVQQLIQDKSSASVATRQVNHRCPDYPHIGSVIQKVFPYHDTIMIFLWTTLSVIFPSLLSWRSISIDLYSEIYLQMVSNAELYYFLRCWHEQIFGQTVGLLYIWDAVAMTFMYYAWLCVLLERKMYVD